MAATYSTPKDDATLLLEFTSGLAQLRVIQRSLEFQHVAGDEFASLEAAIAGLQACYNGLDFNLSEREKVPKRKSKRST